MNAVPVVRVVGAVIVREETVFAARRNPERSAGGLWEFPGGKVEPGEAPEQALARELEEELSVTVTVGPLVDRSLSTVGEKRIELACYLAQLTGAEPSASTDHDAMQWIPLTELDQWDWAPGDVPIIPGLPQRIRDLRAHESEAK
ncbi:(deoxy)nucleoside triphosphate pyrophosphohydrolase [Brachybacterium sp. NBEC-018]|uniref:(deoxy)nucleoside triphosphate pyrophosphohydrolase n=1 Tax=Brachybacterium sp. NBEC-018 TaxID=2996004 RepID=UPI00217563DB|nr:(deoxy)nucleoside triphosphate pyrophosphohydrolase [Brachybacterium sp. NBEC-018]UVY84081.1 (deoxy)nucleoside triphosphate pyrophosphohydrolase [Brachybacterium sp. NBEC-018]